jgi:HD superfamily phosphodiesterase
MDRRGLVKSLVILPAMLQLERVASPQPAKGGKMVHEVSGVKLPDTKLATEATELVRQASPLPLFNHCVRTYVFADSLGKKMNKHYDSELLYLACVMHDLGLVEKYIKDAEFEIDGADAALDFLTHRGYSPERVSVVWEAIALHASMEIPLRRQSEVALVHMGPSWTPAS